MIGHVREVWGYRHFWLSLVRLDLRNKYRKSVLGIGWSFAHPIAMTAVFCVVFSKFMGPENGGWRAYAPFLLCGMCVWDFVRNSVLGGSMSLVQNEAYIRQCPLPFTIYPLRAVLGNVLHVAIALGVVMALVVVLRGSLAPLATAWAIVPGLILTTAFALGLATVAAYATVFFRDVRHLIEVGSQVAYFLTPILYRRNVLDEQGLGVIADLNPANTFIELIRAPLVDGVLPGPGLYVYGVVAASGALLLGAGTTAWLRTRVIFHI
jgi:lipopolysaccharide transport system permease protein